MIYVRFICNFTNTSWKFSTKTLTLQNQNWGAGFIEPGLVLMEHVIYRIPPSYFGGFPVDFPLNIPIHRNGGMNSHEQPAGWCQQKGTSVCVVIFGQDRLLEQLGAFKEPMGPQLLGAREMSVWSLWGMKQIKRYACTWDWTSMYWILAVPQCLFGNFMALIQKKINVRGEFAKDDSRIH